MAGQLPSTLFTWASLGTLTGLTGATVVVTNAVSRATGWNPAWFGLAVSLLFCLGLAIAAHSEWTDYILALLNGCLVYVSAAGTNSVGVVATNVKPSTESQKIESSRFSLRRFFKPWF
jgi:hypothetical protein